MAPLVVSSSLTPGAFVVVLGFFGLQREAGYIGEILEMLVGLKDVSVLQYERLGPHVEMIVEQVVSDVRCPSCNRAVQVKDAR